MTTTVKILNEGPDHITITVEGGMDIVVPPKQFITEYVWVGGRSLMITENKTASKKDG